MNFQILQKIRDNAVKYYNNENLQPQLVEKPTADSVMQYAAFTYAYVIGILQDFGGYDYAIADEVLIETVEKVYNKLEGKSGIINDYNGLMTYCMKEIVKGIDKGHNTIDGATMIKDASANILAISLAYIEEVKLNKEDTVMTFFYGDVTLTEQLLQTAKYIVIDSEAELEIDNAMHIRLVDDQMKLPPVFKVIAPVIAIKGMIGTIPECLLVKLPAKEYLRLRMLHHGA